MACVGSHVPGVCPLADSVTFYFGAVGPEYCVASASGLFSSRSLSCFGSFVPPLELWMG